jgi:hypothetical protein
MIPYKTIGVSSFDTRRHARWAIFVASLLILVCAVPVNAAPAQRNLCHDFTLSRVSHGKEKGRGTDAATLKQKLKHYHYQLERTFPNLSALIHSRYPLKPGQVLLFGTFHSAYVETPTIIAHFFGETYDKARVLHWTLGDFYNFKRTTIPLLKSRSRRFIPCAASQSRYGPT